MNSSTLDAFSTLQPMLVFLCTVAAVAIVWLLAIDSAQDLSYGQRTAIAIGVLVGYLAVPAALAMSGRLDNYSRAPAPALLLIVVLAVLTISMMASPIGRTLAHSVSLAWLVGYQAFRIPVEWWLHRAFEDGFVPAQMTFAGRNFDIVSGVTALALGVAMAFGWRPPRWILVCWNVVALALLVNIVVVAALSTPTSFRVFLSGPPNLLPNTFPYVWLPTFLVQAALAGHVLVFRRVVSRIDGPAASAPMIDRPRGR